jgi:hypothetical protein
LKLYLDDQRPAPPGWELAKTADEAIDLLRTGNIVELSLDYDLGDPIYGTGLQVLDWLEVAIMEGRVRMPRMSAHSASPLGRRRLEAQIELMEQRFQR